MMREIGSEFWDIPSAGQETAWLPGSAQWYLSGRSALKAIIQNLKDCRTVALPSWCCSSMVRPFLDAGMEIRFYPVYWDGKLVQEIRADCDVLLRMEYFGYSDESSEPAGFEGTVIRDVPHSIFTSVYSDADYYFGSLRKWCGVWTGGYAWKRDGRSLPSNQTGGEDFVALRKEAMKQKTEYIYGARTDKGYLKLFEEAELILEQAEISPADPRDIMLSGNLDIETMKKRRRENAKILRDAFPEWLMFPEMKEADSPMFVPVLVPDGKRNALRQYLRENEIYCPVHWPDSSIYHPDERTSEICQNELSLICDQRYSEEDMIRTAETIKRFWKEA